MTPSVSCFTAIPLLPSGQNSNKKPAGNLNHLKILKMKKYWIYMAAAVLLVMVSCRQDLISENPIEETVADDVSIFNRDSVNTASSPVNGGFDDGGDDEEEPKKDKQHWRFP